MTHTRFTTLLAFALGGGALLWAAQLLLTRVGEPAFVPPLSAGVALALVGIIVATMAWPIRQLVRGEKKSEPIDPLYATRVLLLAKASALAGSGVFGATVGVMVFYLTRPVLPLGALWLSLAMCGGALVLTAGGLVAERWCTLPPDSSDPAGNAALEGEPS